MKFLIIEDDERAERQARVSILRAFPRASIVAATNLQDAKALIAAGSYDIGVCDLKIRFEANSLDIDESHGRSAYASLRASSPGTLIAILSAKATSENTSRELSESPTGPAFGHENFTLTRLTRKGTTEFDEYLAEIAEGQAALDQLSVSCPQNLDPMLDRVVRMYGVSLGAERADVVARNGLSTSSVGLVSFSFRDRPPSTVVMKVDLASKIENESARYHKFVAGTLTNGRFASEIRLYRSGIQSMSAIVSALAAPNRESLFQRVSRDPGAGLVSALEEAMAGWSGKHRKTSLRLEDLRRSMIADSDLVGLPDFTPDLLDVGDITLEIDFSIGHGDLHGSNVMIDQAGRAVLIDFADTGEYPAGYDAVALELSLIAHPDSPLANNSWPSPGNLDVWPDLDPFAAGSGVSDFIHACREWAVRSSSPEQVLALAYAQSCWLMKHDHSGRSVARSIALASLRALQPS